MADPEQDEKTPQPQPVGIREFRAKLPAYLRQAEQGAPLLITSHGRAVAEIRPPSPTKQFRRQPGRLRGRIRMAADFDTLPPGVLAAMEGEEG